MPKNKLSKKYYRLLVFWVGITATFSYRVIVILNHYSALWVEIAWHIGTIGFIWYFAHRYRVARDRANSIKERKLIDKIYNERKLDQDDRDALIYILKGLRSSKAKWNYIAIFAFSVLALIYSFFNNIILKF